MWTRYDIRTDEIPFVLRDDLSSSASGCSDLNTLEEKARLMSASVSGLETICPFGAAFFLRPDIPLATCHTPTKLRVEAEPMAKIKPLPRLSSSKSTLSVGLEVGARVSPSRVGLNVGETVGSTPPRASSIKANFGRIRVKTPKKLFPQPTRSFNTPISVSSPLAGLTPKSGAPSSPVQSELKLMSSSSSSSSSLFRMLPKPAQISS
mmetsp:Transcript_5752/g.10778  ORF Transcript_5752/g.10778 Transcript_5752/m.10778 type:complete len:207 (+) Transcript_5752:312-932(+)